MSQFQGLSSSSGFSSIANQGTAPGSPDVTPASVNWNNPIGDGVLTADTINQTISGIDTTIYIILDTSSNPDNAIHYFSKNDGPWINTTSYNSEGGGDAVNFPIAIKNGDTLKWRMEYISNTLTIMLVKNTSDSNTVLDTIQFETINNAGGGPA